MTDEWETLGRKIAGLYLVDRLENLSAATHTLDRKIRDGEELTKADIKQFRNALAALQSFVETDLTTVAEDEIKPYEDALFHVHNQALVEYATDFRHSDGATNGND